MAGEVARLFVSVGADVSGAIRGLDTVSSKITSFGTTMAGAGAALSLGLTAPLALLGKAGLGAAMDFQAAINLVGATSGASASELAALSARAKELGADLTLPATSAADAATAMLELSKAGLSVTNILGASKGVLQLSAAGAISNAEAAKTAATMLNAFGLEGSQATRVADLLAAAANASSAEVGDLAVGAQQSAFAFKSAGQPIEHMVTSLAALTNVGLTGSDAGTAIKNAFIRLMAPTAKAKKEINNLGLAFYDAKGNMKQLPDIIAELNRVTGKMTQEQRNATLENIFLSDGMKAMIPLLALGKQGFLDLEGQVMRQGAAADLAGTRMKGLGGAIQGFPSVAETTLMNVAEPFMGMLEGLVRWGSELVTKFDALDPSIKNAAVAVGLALAVVGPLALGLGGLAVVAGALLSPIGLLAVAMAAVGVAIALHPELIGKITDGWDKFSSLVGTVINPAMTDLSTIVGELATNTGEQLTRLWDVLGPKMEDIGRVVSEYIGPAFQWFGSTVLQGLLGQVRAIVSVFSALLEFMVGVSNAIIRTVALLSAVVTETVATMAQAITAAFAHDWVNAAKLAEKSMQQATIGMALVASAGASQIGTAIVEGIKKIGSDIVKEEGNFAPFKASPMWGAPAATSLAQQNKDREDLLRRHGVTGMAAAGPAGGAGAQAATTAAAAAVASSPAVVGAAADAADKVGAAGGVGGGDTYNFTFHFSQNIDPTDRAEMEAAARDTIVPAIVKEIMLAGRQR